VIGEGMFGPAVNGRGIRSLAAPGQAYDDPALGRDPQPSHLRDYVETEEDNGGVHINSGIPNFAFAFASSVLGGQTWDLLGRVWYRVLTTRLHADATFKSFATDTVNVAGQLFGDDSDVVEALVCGWTCVGVPFDFPARRNRTYVRRLPLEMCLECVEPLYEMYGSGENDDDNTNNNDNTIN
jgi:Zn-dependent metalloprotease